MPFNPGNAAQTIAAALMGHTQGAKDRRQRKTENLNLQLLEGRVEDRQKPKWSLVPDGQGGYSMVGINPDGTTVTGVSKAGTGGFGRGVSIWTNPADSRPYVIDRAKGTGQAISFTGGDPTRKPGALRQDRNTGKWYNMIINPDGTQTQGSVAMVPGKTTDTETEIVGGKEVSSSTTEKGPLGKVKIKKKIDPVPLPLDKETDHTLMTRLNVLMAKIPSEDAAKQEKGALWHGPEPDAVVVGQHKMMLREIVEIGNILRSRGRDVDIAIYEKMLGENKSMEDIIGAIEDTMTEPERGGL